MKATTARKVLHSHASPEIAASSASYFKTGPGQYGAGDKFIGVRVPTVRLVAREFQELPLAEVEKLLQSPIHEERLLALLVLVLSLNKCSAAHRQEVYEFYLVHRRWVNNWDLVDTSAPTIVGGYLRNYSREPLYRLAESNVLWERRIAIIATQHFIRLGELDDALAISLKLLDDQADLIHKATGWMLREVGKKDTAVLQRFLERHAPRMPRTMLRHAIEKFSSEQRQAFLNARPKSPS